MSSAMARCASGIRSSSFGKYENTSSANYQVAKQTYVSPPCAVLITCLNLLKALSSGVQRRQAAGDCTRNGTYCGTYCIVAFIQACGAQPPHTYALLFPSYRPIIRLWQH